MNSSMFVSVLIGSLLLGCATDRPSPSASPLPSPASSSPTPGAIALPDPAQADALTPTQADRLMAAVVEAINTNQPQIVAPYVWPAAQQGDQVAVAIADFQTVFNGEAIATVESI